MNYVRVFATAKGFHTCTLAKDKPLSLQFPWFTSSHASWWRLRLVVAMINIVFFFEKHHGIKSDSATSPDCATRIAKLGLRNSQDCATPLAQLPELRNSACATRRIAQLVGLRNFACATAFDKLRSSQDCATLLVQLRWPDWATLQLHFLQTIPTPMELQTDLECPRG